MGNRYGLSVFGLYCAPIRNGSATLAEFVSTSRPERNVRRGREYTYPLPWAEGAQQGKHRSRIELIAREHLMIAKQPFDEIAAPNI